MQGLTCKTRSTLQEAYRSAWIHCLLVQNCDLTQINSTMFFRVAPIFQFSPLLVLVASLRYIVFCLLWFSPAPIPLFKPGLLMTQVPNVLCANQASQTMFPHINTMCLWKNVFHSATLQQHDTPVGDSLLFSIVLHSSHHLYFQPPAMALKSPSLVYAVTISFRLACTIETLTESSAAVRPLRWLKPVQWRFISNSIKQYQNAYLL